MSFISGQDVFARKSRRAHTVPTAAIIPEFSYMAHYGTSTMYTGLAPTMKDVLYMKDMPYMKDVPYIYIYIVEGHPPIAQYIYIWHILAHPSHERPRSVPPLSLGATGQELGGATGTLRAETIDIRESETEALE